MVKDVVSFLDYSVCAEISLAIFVTVFVAVTLRTMLFNREQTNHMASLPLEEGRKEQAE